LTEVALGTFLLKPIRPNSVLLREPIHLCLVLFVFYRYLHQFFSEVESLGLELFEIQRYGVVTVENVLCDADRRRFAKVFV
jgi:hypothetical protein